MSTSTATAGRPAAGCGCGCGGAAAQTAIAFLRPNFFAGQLLTEDDLQALTGYVAGKNRLRNRLLFGPGVVCGLEVVCDPCGGGRVTVRPGYALDCRGNDIVVDCPERVDVNALVRDLRIRSLGVDCGDGCDCGGTRCSHSGDGSRRYGLYVRYTEEPTDPIAPYPTDDCPTSIGCSPSRIRETYTFLIKCARSTGHWYTPAAALATRLGDPATLAMVQGWDRRLARYEGPLRDTVLAASATVPFDQATADRLASAATDLDAALAQVGDQVPAAQVPRVTELVRALASAVARYLVSDQTAGVDVGGARGTLAVACQKLTGTDTLAIWGDPLRQALASAVLSETNDRVLVDRSEVPAPLELRMLAQGAPLSYPLRVALGKDLSQLREWLLVRYDSAGGLTDCTASGTVTALMPPPALPEQPTGDRAHPTATELSTTAAAIGGLHAALLGFLADSACASLHPPCGDCADSDLPLAVLTVDDCAVVDICTAGREQVLPGGSGYAAWLPTLYQARTLAEQVCCRPVTSPPGPPDGSLPYLANLFDDPPPTALDELLALLAGTGTATTGPARTKPGTTGPAELRPAEMTAVTTGAAGAAAGGSAEADGVRRQLAELRAQVATLTGAIADLRDQAGQEPAGSAQAGSAQPGSGGDESTGTGDGQTGAGPEPDEAQPAKAAAARSTPTKSAPTKAAGAKAAPGRATRTGRGASRGQEH